MDNNQLVNIAIHKVVILVCFINMNRLILNHHLTLPD